MPFGDMDAKPHLAYRFGMNLGEIGRRIMAARGRLEISRETLGASVKRSGETVRLWELGRVAPPLEVIQGIALELRESEEFLLFGIRRGEQLQAERPILDWLYPSEVEFLTIFRQTSPAGQRALLESARGIARANPAPEAGIMSFKRGRKRR